MILRRSLLRQSRHLHPTPSPSSSSFSTTTTRALPSTTDLYPDTASITDNEPPSNYKLIPHNNPDLEKTTTLQSENLSAAFSRLQVSRAYTKSLGTTVTPPSTTRDLLHTPPAPSAITIPLLIASQTHLGHATSHWNPQNAAYIFGKRQGIHIVSPEVTASHLRRASRVVHGVALRGGVILFVGTRPGQERFLIKAAERVKGCHLFQRWVAGTITNGRQLLGTCAVKGVDEFDREVEAPGTGAGGDGEEGEDVGQGGGRGVICKPDLVVVLDPKENWVLLRECGQNGIPTIGVVDTDADPTWVTYTVPANDDSLRSVGLIAGVLSRAGEEGRRERLERAGRGEVLYAPAVEKKEKMGQGGGRGGR